MQWKIFPLTDEEACIDICTGFAYADLNRGRWIDSNYGVYSPETHFDIAIERFIVNSVAYKVVSLYMIEDENLGLIILQPMHTCKEDKAYIIKNLRRYGLSIEGVTDTDESVKYIQQQRQFEDIYKNTHKDGNNIGIEGNKSTKK